VAAALESGAHYCDITGELNWVKRMIDAHHDAAAAKGVKVRACAEGGEPCAHKTRKDVISVTLHSILKAAPPTPKLLFSIYTQIVHCCGYDSVPFDIGALVVVDHIRQKLGVGTGQVYGLLEDARGGVSGGTIASAVNVRFMNALLLFLLALFVLLLGVLRV
jgi:hypothetical protein